MDRQQQENICDLLERFSFDINLDLYKVLTCTICKNILRDPHQSVCGCKYCFSCINNYLNGETKSCPGNCDEKMISMENDIIIDVESNKNISMIKVKCPEDFCRFIDELKNIFDHIKSHQIKCPYQNLGCSKPKMREDSINNHLHNKNYDHTILLMDFIYNLKNEMATIKEELNENKEALKIKEALLDLMQDDIKKLKVIGKISMQKIAECDIRNEKLISEIEINKEENKKFYNKSMKSKNERKKQEINISLLNGTHDSSINKLSKQIDYQDIQTTIDKKYKIAPFEWNIQLFKTIENPSGKIEKQFIRRNIYSEPFYSHRNGYKLCLRVCPGGLSFGLSIYFHIMKGDFDDVLKWPMPNLITIGLVNQISRHWEIKKSYQYKQNDSKNIKPNSKKPKTEINLGNGTKFINLNDHSNKDGIVNNGWICMRCLINVDP